MQINTEVFNDFLEKTQNKCHVHEVKLERINMKIENFNDSMEYLIDIDENQNDHYGITHNLLETDKFIRELSINVNYLRQEIDSTNKRITYEVNSLDERLKKVERLVL